MRARVWDSVLIFMCVCACVYMCTCMRARMHVSVCVGGDVRVCVNVYVCEQVCVVCTC